MRWIAVLLILVSPAFADEKRAAELVEHYGKLRGADQRSPERERMKVLRRLGGSPANTARKFLLGVCRSSPSVDDRFVALPAACRIADVATIEALIRYVDKANDPVITTAFADALAAAPEDVKKWIVTTGLVEVTGPALEALVTVSGDTKHGKTETRIRGIYRLTEVKPKQVRIAAAAIRAFGILGTSNWQDPLLAAAGHENATVRKAAAGALAALPEQDEKSIAALRSLLSDRDAGVRQTAMRHVGRKKLTALSPYLIDLLSETSIRNRGEAHEALIRISGLDYGYSTEPWFTWWEKREKLTPATPQVTAGTLGYYGIPTATDRALILYETTGYMNWPWRSATPKRHVVARAELERLLGLFPKGSKFNLVAFNEKVKAWKKKPVDTDEKNIARVLKWIDKALVREGKPDLHRALVTALTKFDDCDRIYLISTGWRSTGKVNSPEAILPEMRVLCEERGIEIMTIGLTLESLDYGRPNHYPQNTVFLVDLAAATGGRTKQFKSPPRR